VLFQPFPHARAKLVDVARRARDAYDRQVECSAPDHRLQCRENLLACKIARGRREAPWRRNPTPGPMPTSSGRSVRFQVAAKREAHRRQHPIEELGVSARTEPLVERGAKHRRRHALAELIGGRALPELRVLRLAPVLRAHFLDVMSIIPRSRHALHARYIHSEHRRLRAGK
jgi:hypothetical protein